MKDFRLKSFVYNCSCGHIVRVFFDFGVPQEFYKCRKCGSQVKRMEAQL